MSAATTQNPKFARPAKLVMAGDREMHIERVFDASRDRVWRAMTDPRLVAQWWGRGNKLDVVTFDMERGGHWRFVEHSDHGDHGFEGRYGDIVAPERIVQTFEWDGMPAHPVRETMTLTELGDGRTRMNITSQFYTREERDGMAQSGMETGMNQSYEALDRVLESMK